MMNIMTTASDRFKSDRNFKFRIRDIKKVCLKFPALHQMKNEEF